MEQIRKIIVRMIWGMLLFLPRTAYAQVPIHIPCNKADSNAHTNFYADATRRLRFGTDRDWLCILINTTGKRTYGYGAYTRPAFIDRSPPDTSMPSSSDEELTLLGSRWKTGVEQSPLANVLLVGTFLDSTSNRKWALIEMFAFIQADSSISPWETFYHPDVPGKNSLRIYDHKPTNADIYRFLDDWAPFDGGFFTSEDDPLIFLEGEICEETWTNMVGEPPTRFFPEGEGE